MKSILISIKPKYVADILNGKKTIEIKKTMPKCDLPIDVYIYCTKDSKQLVHYQDVPNENFSKRESFFETKQLKTKSMFNGKIVAKFTLNKVEEIRFNDKEVQRKSCLTENELFDYLFVNEPYHEDMKKGYAWNISNLVIFDKPKELSEFCYYNVVKNNLYAYGEFPLKTHLTKAPQSWCYVEVEVDE